MQTVTSADGTRLSLDLSGSGPALLLVHGAFVDPRVSPALVAVLARTFTVGVLHRRGRVGSGPFGADHAIERDFEDVAAAVDRLGHPAVVVGHSYGAWCALYGVRLSRSGADRLVLYEPAPFGAPPGPTVEHIRAALAAGTPDDAVATLLHEVNGMPQPAVESMRGSPFWRLLLANVDVFVPELEALGAFRFEPERFAGFDVPTLLLAGATSPRQLRSMVTLVAGALPDARVQEIPDQGHGAMSSAPELFAGFVRGFGAF